MHRRMRVLCLTTSGLLAAAALLLATPQPASAADNYASKQLQITFIDDFGTGHTCPLNNLTDHNTDDPNQPYTEVSAFAGGDQACYTGVLLTVTINYKDKNGVARQASAHSNSNDLTLDEPATYAAINTTVDAYCYNCNPHQSATCELSVTVAPK